MSSFGAEANTTHRSFADHDHSFEYVHVTLADILNDLEDYLKNTINNKNASLASLKLTITVPKGDLKSIGKS